MLVAFQKPSPAVRDGRLPFKYFLSLVVKKYKSFPILWLKCPVNKLQWPWDKEWSISYMMHEWQDFLIGMSMQSVRMWKLSHGFSIFVSFDILFGSDLWSKKPKKCNKDESNEQLVSRKNPKEKKEKWRKKKKKTRSYIHDWTSRNHFNQRKKNWNEEIIERNRILDQGYWTWISKTKLSHPILKEFLGYEIMFVSMVHSWKTQKKRREKEKKNKPYIQQIHTQKERRTKDEEIIERNHNLEHDWTRISKD